MHYISENNKSNFYISKSSDKKKDSSHSLKNNRNQNNIKNIKKELNLCDFVNQKNKFNIKSFFDEKESKNFLSLKKKALMEIKLDDEISKEEKGHNSKSELLNQSLSREKNASNKKLKFNILKERTMSPKIKKVKSKGKKNSIKLFDTINKDKSNFDSNDSNKIYQFIINNADESDEKFHEKLEKELKRIETKKRLSRKKTNTDIIYKSLTTQKNKKERCSSIKTEKNKIALTAFVFSENAKKLMSNQNLEVSSINNDETTTPDKQQMKTVESYNKKENAKLNLFGEKDIIKDKQNNENKEINSDNQSLLSIISDLF